MGTWELVERPKGVVPIGNKLIFTKKRDKIGQILRYKARLVAKGYAQRPGCDYLECHDRPKNFIFPGPSGGTTLVPYPTVAPTTPSILTPQNSITILGAQPMHASPTSPPVSSIKEQLTFAIAAPQPSRLIIPSDVQHSIRNPLPPQMDQYMSSPSPPIPDQAVFLGGDNDATMSSPYQSPPDHLPHYYQGWEIASPTYALRWLARDPNCLMDGPGREPVIVPSACTSSPSSISSAPKCRQLEAGRYSLHGHSGDADISEPDRTAASQCHSSYLPSGYASPEDIPKGSRGDIASLPSP